MTDIRDLLGALFEGAPRFVERLSRESANSWNELLDRAQAIAEAMPEEEQVELIDSHPRIGADPRTVSAISYREQGYDLDTPDEQGTQAALDRLNAAYERRFGFRFVVYVAGRPRSAIVPLIEEALRRERSEEIDRALKDIVAIARDRLSTLVARQEERV
jgi:2-oxo-4-hydroxy-4-carboxy--5-ureidoimidazoline (OHCU) decarboxylase